MKKLIVLSLVAMLAVPMTVHAEEDRIAALEEKVAALEQRVAALEGGAAPAGVSAVPDQEVLSPEDVETGLIANNCSFDFVDYEVTKTYDDYDCVILYFDFVNGSGETTMASTQFGVTVFQHSKEQDFGVVSGNQEQSDYNAKIRSGPDVFHVAYTSKIQDMSDIIVNVYSRSDRSVEPIEFTLSLE